MPDFSIARVRARVRALRQFDRRFGFSGSNPHHRLRRSCLAQVDLVLRSAILHRKCKIAKLMCAQKSHRGYLHNAHIRPEGEALRSCALCYPLCEKRLHLLCLFVAANFAFRTLRKRKAQCCAVAAPLRKNLFCENIFASYE